MKNDQTKNIRKFTTGAIRDSDQQKIDPEGFLSPLVIERYCQYMHKHRFMADGSVRESDNWQKGIPVDVYMKSMWRHFLDIWKWHRKVDEMVDIEESLCALLFNVQGMLFEILKSKEEKNKLSRR